MNNILKTLGPTLLSLATVAASQLAPIVQQWISAHPKWSAALGALGLAVAHWLPSPLQQSNPVSSQAGFVRLAALPGLLALMIFSLVVTPVMITTTGCNGSALLAGIQDVESKLPQIGQIAAGLLLEVAPEYAPAVQPIVTDLQNVGKVVMDGVAAYKANPSAGQLQKINAAVAAGIQDLTNLAAIPGIKDTHTQGVINIAAGSFALIFNDIASWVQNLPATVVSQLPAFYGWGIPGVNLVAIDGSKLPAPAAGKTKHSGFTARDIAAHWNKVVKHEQAKIHEPLKHMLGIPIPFTGHK
jgi:hypothetical protein